MLEVSPRQHYSELEKVVAKIKISAYFVTIFYFYIF